MKRISLVLLTLCLAGAYQLQASAQGGWRQWDIYLHDGSRIEANPLGLTDDGRLTRSLRSDASPGEGIERSKIRYLAARWRNLPPVPAGVHGQDLVVLLDGRRSSGPVTFRSIRFSEGTIVQQGVEIDLKNVAYIIFANPGGGGRPPEGGSRRSAAGVRPAGRSTDRAHTPPKGSAERKAILDALRRELSRLHGTEAVFVVRRLKVQRGWAWVEALPQSADGANRYEGLSALLSKRGGRWRVEELACAEEENPDCVGHADFFVRLGRRFPEAPRAIFP